MVFFQPSFYLPAHVSPSYHQLSHYLLANGWVPGSEKQADFGERHFQFHSLAAKCLEYKHHLANLVELYCPDIMPVTYVIYDNNWSEVLPLIVDDRVWILKPALLNNGQHITLFSNVLAIERYFSSNQRLSGPYVLQSYINTPHLLRDNRKYSIRHFMVLSSHQGAFLYPYGYYNVAKQSFDSNDFTDLSAHLTNEHLYGQEPNVIQIPSHLFSGHPKLYQQIKKIVIRLISALKQHYPDAFQSHSEPRLALFGMDFMVDNTGRVWLLEANHGPCFPIDESHPLQEPLYKDFWQALIASFVTPDSSQAIVFEKI